MPLRDTSNGEITFPGELSTRSAFASSAALAKICSLRLVDAKYSRALSGDHAGAMLRSLSSENGVARLRATSISQIAKYPLSTR